MAVAAAVLTTTEGEDVGTVDTAAAVTSEAGGTPTVARTRYEFDLPWTPEEEQKLAEASSLNPGLVSVVSCESATFCCQSDSYFLLSCV